MPKQKNSILGKVSEYYDAKLAEHGETPKGVDWNGEESQYLRFEQLSKIIQVPGRFTINDIGCGYGAYYDYLSSVYSDFSYAGIDISEPMIDAASRRLKNATNANLIISEKPDTVADYAIASGLFNVRLEHTEAEWTAYIHDTLTILDQSCSRGFAFNCLTSYSDADRKRDYLHYANPGQLFDYCKTQHSPQIALFHDYGLYEFTILVRKQ